MAEFTCQQPPIKLDIINNAVFYYVGRTVILCVIHIVGIRRPLFILLYIFLINSVCINEFNKGDFNIMENGLKRCLR